MTNIRQSNIKPNHYLVNVLERYGEFETITRRITQANSDAEAREKAFESLYEDLEPDEYELHDDWIGFYGCQYAMQIDNCKEISTSEYMVLERLGF